MRVMAADGLRRGACVTRAGDEPIWKPPPHRPELVRHAAARLRGECYHRPVTVKRPRLHALCAHWKCFRGSDGGVACLVWAVCVFVWDAISTPADTVWTATVRCRFVGGGLGDVGVYCDRRWRLRHKIAISSIVQ